MEPSFVYVSCVITVLVFGIIGNTLVIMSILRQKKLLKNNYYLLVLQLAINDLAVLIIYLLDDITRVTFEKTLYDQFLTYRLYYNICYLFQVAGIGMMIFISVIRYRATLHPLKPALSGRKMRNVCCLVYIFGLIAGYGSSMPYSILYGKDMPIIYLKFDSVYLIFFYYTFPTLFMAVIYYKICRELIQQNKRRINLCSNSSRQTTPDSSFNILTFIRNRRTSLVSFCTVLCYGVGNVPMSVLVSWQTFGKYHLLENYLWVNYFANVIRVFSSHAVNPLIYGILDKKLLFLWKRKLFKRKHTSQGN